MPVVFGRKKTKQTNRRKKKKTTKELHSGVKAGLRKESTESIYLNDVTKKKNTTSNHLICSLSKEYGISEHRKFITGCRQFLAHTYICINIYIYILAITFAMMEVLYCI